VAARRSLTSHQGLAMPPRYVINSLTRQTIDTTVKFAANISVPCATVETAEAFADLASVPGNPGYASLTQTLTAATVNVALEVGGLTLSLGERFFLLLVTDNQERGGVYRLTRVATPILGWQAVRAGDFNSDQAIALGSHIYAINQGDLAGQFIALSNETQIVLDTTPIEAELAGTPNPAVGTSFSTAIAQSFTIAANDEDYVLPTLAAGDRRRVEVDIYGSNAGGTELFLQQSNLVAVRVGANSIGAETANPTFSFFNLAAFATLTVTYEPGALGVDLVRIDNAAQIENLFATVQITVWDTPITI
jgi:hypothetical protein